jgi:two-component system chemotaxis response regulator CheY
MAKILVVDDSKALRMQLRRDLEKAGHKVVEAENGQVGISQVGQNPDIEMILCDVNMPVMDGLAMCEQLFQTESFRAIPKFMLTTEAFPALKQRAKEAGVMAWIIKPYTAEKLLAEISKVVKVGGS